MRLLLFCILSNLILTACITQIIPRVSIDEFDDVPFLLKNPPSPLVSELFVRLQLDYVEVKRFDPDVMLASAVHQLNIGVPEVNTQIQEKQSVAHSKPLFITIHISQKNYQIPFVNLSNLSDLNLTIQKTLNFLKKELPHSKFIKAEQAMVKGILATLDPHSNAMFTHQYQDFQKQTQGRFGGIGVIVKYDMEKGLKILQVIANSPAYTAGLKSGEWITEIDGELVQSMDVESAQTQLQGMIGTSVKLKIRKANQEEYDIHLPRAIIHPPSVEIQTIQQKIVFIKIKFFQQNTVAQLYDVLNQTQDIEGIILDMRNNPGGLLQQAVLTANFFLPPKKRITSTEGTLEQTFVSQWILKDKRLNKIPLAILINRTSASGSEIVASALKERPNTVLLGDKTFGKGSVQNLQSLNNKHGLKLTVAKYLKPDGGSIQAVGETPHIRIQTVHWNQKKFFIKNQPPREENLAKVFKWGESLNDANFQLQYFHIQNSHQNLAQTLNFLPSYQFQNKKDFAKDFAVESLKQALIQKDDLKKVALELAKKIQIAEEKKMIETLQKDGIDWRQHSHFIRELKVHFQASWKSEPLDLSQKNHTVRLHWTLQNMDDELERLKLRVKILNQSSPIWEIPIGSLEKNKTISQEQKLILPYHDVLRLQASLIDGKGRLLSQHDQVIIPEQVVPPKLKVQLAIRDNGDWGSRGNGNGMVEPNEKIALRVQVSNHGHQATGQLKVRLNPIHTIKSIRRTDHISELKAGETKTMTMLYVAKQQSSLLIDQLEFSDSLFKSNHFVYQFNLTQAEHVQTCCNIPILNLNVFKNQQTSIHQTTIQTKVIANDQIKSVLLSNNDKKIAFFDVQKTTFNIQKKVNLQKGINRILLTVITQTGFQTQKHLTLWHSPTHQHDTSY